MSGASAGPRPPYGWAALAGSAVGLLYVFTLAPTTAFWDTSEYIATAHILGIPHPPGNPLFVVLARTWEVLLAPFGLSTAVRVNLFSTLMSSLAHGLWFLVMHHVLRYFSEDRRFRLCGAGVAVLCSATAFTVWNQSNVNEKVYTVSLFTIALLSWLAFRWQETLDKGRHGNLLVLMAFVLALSVGNHLMAFLAAPALLIFVLIVRPSTLLQPRLYAAGALALVLGLSIHLFLPVRSELGPVINEAQPTCEGVGDALGAIVTYGNAGCEELSGALKREQYDKPPLMPRLAPLSSQFRNWLQYFDWQWARGIDGDSVLFGKARAPFTILFIVLGVFGMVEHYRRDKASWAYMASLFAVLSVGLTYYLNFKYGYSIPAPVNDPELHEVRERDYFFVAGFSVWGLLAGVGIAALWERATRAMRKRRRSLLVGSPVLGLALIPLIFNFDRASRAGDYSARDWAHNLLMSVEPYALLFTNGDNDTFPLWYLQEVEGIRRDVTIAVTSYLNTDWYVKQLRDLTRPCEPGQDPEAEPTRTRIVCQRPYTADNATAMYTHDPAAAREAGKTPLVTAQPVRPPTRSVFHELDDETVGKVATSYFPLEEARQMNLGPLVATMAADQYMYPWHQFALAAIARSLGDRPVYFASSGSAGAASTFGLRYHLVRQGLAFRLWPGDPAELESQGVRRNTDTSALAGVVGPWLDAERTRVLAEEVFVHRGGLPDEWDYWPDGSTVGIPNYYAWVFLGLYQDALRQNDEEAANRFADRWEAWTQLGVLPASAQR